MVLCTVVIDVVSEPVSYGIVIVLLNTLPLKIQSLILILLLNMCIFITFVNTFTIIMIVITIIS